VKKHLCDDLIRMNVKTIIINDETNNKIVSSLYLLEFYDVWHDRLGHVNYNSMKILIRP
jgi:hypothetical protein